MERLKLNNTNKGIILITASAFCFALMGMFVRLAGDLPAMQKSFFRNIVALVFSVAVLLKEHKKITVPKSAVKYLFLRAFFGTVGIVCNFYAIGKLVLADASILNKMSPFFAILGSLLILKEKISPKKAIIVLAAFIGCLFVIKPTFRNAELIPSLIGLLGGFGAGIAYTMVHKLGQEKVEGSFIVFFFSAFSTLVFLPFMIAEYKPMTALQLIYRLRYHNSHGGRNVLFKPQISKKRITRSTLSKKHRDCFSSPCAFLVLFLYNERFFPRPRHAA